MPEFQINYLAVGIAAFATVFIGAIWYSPILFHKLWVRVHGYSEDEVEQMRKKSGRAFLVSFLCYVVMATVLAIFVSYAGASTALQGASLGFLVWIGFLATLGLTAHMFSEKPLSTYFIDIGYQLVYSVVMGIILTVWQ